MEDFLNLQNTSTPADIASENVTFASAEDVVQGTIYRPKERTGLLPAIVVSGAWTTVKEQMAGTYAREFAARGFAALAFDFRGWGESEGLPRFVEDPIRKTEDIDAAVDFVSGLDDIDPAQVFVVGICASSGYVAAVAADNRNVKSAALVAPWLHNPMLAEEIYGGPDVAASLIASSDAAMESPTPVLLTAASVEDESAPMYQAPYYTEPHRGLIGEYDNKFDVRTWRSWLTYDAMENAGRLEKPLLLVGSDSIALPKGVSIFIGESSAPITKVWLGSDVTQFDFYDRADAVSASSDAVAAFFKG